MEVKEKKLSWRRGYKFLKMITSHLESKEERITDEKKKKKQTNKKTKTERALNCYNRGGRLSDIMNG